MDSIINMIRPELLILAVVLYGLGMILKKTSLKDNFIPLILGAAGLTVGITYCGIVEGFTWAVIGTGAVQGLLCAAASNYVNQVIKQMQKLGDPKADIVEYVVEQIEEKLGEPTEEKE